MQREMEVVMSKAGAVSENCDTDASLVDRAKQATLDAQMQDELALHEVHVMNNYRPRLLRAGTAAARIRSEVFDVLVETARRADAEFRPTCESEVFWDGIALSH
jgi:hypothetical protein